LRDAIITSLENRPEIDSAIRQVQAASIRQKMAKNEVLPVLNLILETYVEGLRGEFDMEDALSDQFEEGGPSYTVGFRFEMPLPNDEARARKLRRDIEVRQMTQQMRTTVSTLLLEVEVSVRELKTAYEEIQSNYKAMTASNADLKSMVERRALLTDANQLTSNYLENLLAAQERLADAEFAFLRSIAAYNISLVNLERSKGTLLKYENFEPKRSRKEGLPVLKYEKVQPEIASEMKVEK
jgi:outer membrane protein TolC